MIKLPFNSNQKEFAAEMKSKISGVNLTLEYENIESSLCKIAVEIPVSISEGTYNRLVNEYGNPDSTDLNKKAVDLLQRVMLHFAIYEHLIFLITRIGNDGVTIKKNDDETTAFKYQTDELKDKLITTGWFWMNQLIQLLNKNPDLFQEWENSEEKKAFDALPVTLKDFNKWVGVGSTGGEYFMISAGWIIREVWIDCVCSRMKEPKKTDSIVRAVCYEVMGRACELLAYSSLPEPIRKDINNEMSKSNSQQAEKDIREKIAEKFKSKARTYWISVDQELKKIAIKEQNANIINRPVIGENLTGEEDKFIVS